MIIVSTRKTDYPSQYQVYWNLLHSTRQGVMSVRVPDGLKDPKACVEIFALSRLLDRFSGQAGHVATSHGLLGRLLKGKRDRYAASEMAALQVLYPELQLDVHKKYDRLATEPEGNLEVEELTWEGLGRPSVETSLGAVEVTCHAFERYRERVAPTGNLNRLRRLLSRKLIPVSVKTAKYPTRHRAERFSVLEVENSRIRVVVAHSPGRVDRLTTCYMA